MVTIKKGDLLNATETIIAHQVNCRGVVGGLAADVFEKWPVAGSDYRQLCDRIAANNLLGLAHSTGRQPDGHIIANLYGQLLPGRNYRPDALESALEMLADMARTMNWSVALPWKISCGICGGDWKEVRKIIERTMDGVNCVIYQREGDE